MEPDTAPPIRTRTRKALKTTERIVIIFISVSMSITTVSILQDFRKKSRVFSTFFADLGKNNSHVSEYLLTILGS